MRSGTGSSAQIQIPFRDSTTNYKAFYETRNFVEAKCKTLREISVNLLLHEFNLTEHEIIKLPFCDSTII